MIKRDTFSNGIKNTFSLLLLLLIICSTSTFAQVDVTQGEKLFKSNCASCHKIDKKLVGPPLQGVTSNRSQDWLLAWVKDNVSLRKSGDIDAIAIYEEYKGSAMNTFPQLSDDDVLSILSYVDEKALALANAQIDVVSNIETTQSNNTQKLIITSIILIIIIFLLASIKNTLKHSQGLPTTTLFEDIKAYIVVFTSNKKLIVLTSILLGVFVVNGAWNFLIGIGVSKGYQPIQPIAFSHEVHAGQNKIDCNYCHSSARHSRVAGIPSANVCMNCHKYIQEGTKTGMVEIQKIYDAIGFDPTEGEYIEGYDQRPIKWVKVHNLPDLTYFNHSQHVSVAGVECQTCHGPIEEMEEVYQFAELTMNFCIDCHQSTEVKTMDNPYYDTLHNELLEKYHGETITVDKIGGLECGKCHY